MLQVKHLTITHKKDLRILLEDFSLSLQPGDKAAIIGEEGNGKSTLLRLIAGDPLVEEYVEYTGEILRGGSRIGLLSQEWTAGSLDLSVWEYCSQNGKFLEQTPRELATLARRLGLNPAFFYAAQPLASLSGGERTKLQLALLLAEEPDLLLLDEPSNDLDVETLVWLEQFIQDCPQPVLYVSHDETLLERTANVILHLEQLRKKSSPRYTVARLSYQEYVSSRQRLLDRQEQTAKKEQSEFRQKQERFRRIQQKVEHQQNAISRGDPYRAALLKKKMHTVKAMERRYEKEQANLTQRPDTEEAIFFRFPANISLPASKRVLDLDLPELSVEGRILAQNVHLHVRGPEKIGIWGPNGAGKSTLLKRIVQLFQGREDLTAAYMPQNYQEVLDFDQTPVDALAQTGDREERRRICTYLGSLRYTEEERNHPIRDLSGGQKAKLLLLSLSLSGSPVLLLDEPTRNLSPLSNPVIRQMLSAFPGAIISVSHDRKYLSQVCTRLLRLTEAGLEPADCPDPPAHF